MNRILLAAAAALVMLGSCKQQAIEEIPGDGTATSVFEGSVDYDTHFTPERLRIDFILAGDKDTQYAFLDELHKEPSWAGSPSSLIDFMRYGQYFFEAFENDELVYSHGFSTLFEEWRTTPQARTTPMAAGQTVWMPFPKNPVHIVLYERIRSTGKFHKFYECDVDPSDTHIIPGPDNHFQVTYLQYKGDPAHKVDLVFAGEAYTEEQLPKLRADATRMMEYLFTMEPYASRREDFNVCLVESISEDDGVDIPNHGQWKNTVMNSTFDTFYEDRYLTIMNHKNIASVLSGVPFDAAFIIANETKYGGGGIYGSYAMGTSDNRASDIVFVHEFGHLFAALGDEYYDSSVAYEDYYPLDVEPWEPNLTTLVNFDAKWKDMIDAGTPVPTPNDPQYKDVTGLFEGAGYMTKGCYRPYLECRMLNNTAPAFCPVCQKAISDMIDFYVR